MNLPQGMDLPTLLVLGAPLLLLQLGLLGFAIRDLLRDDRQVRGGSKPMWALIIVFMNVIGPVLYFLVGREDGPVGPSGPGAPGWGSPHDPKPAPPPATTPRPADAISSTPASREAPTTPAPVDADAPSATPPSARAPRPDTPAATGSAADVIVVAGLTRRYAGGVLALDRLDLRVPQGSVFGLLGPNGAGKTTTLRILAGLLAPTAGIATVAGHAVSTTNLAVRRSLGWLEQDPRAYRWMTGREQVTLLAQLHGLGGTELDRAVSDALTRAGLADVADRRSGTYSGGMRQRLGIAGALVHRPPVLILDEPVSALDPEGRRDVLALISELRGTTTVLFSTHVLADVERICDRVGILDHGRLVAEAPLADLLDRYALPVWRIEAEPGEGAGLEALAASLGALPWVGGTSLEHGVLTVAVADPVAAGRELLGVVAASGVAVVDVGRAGPTLEDVFLRLTAPGTGEVAA